MPGLTTMWLRFDLGGMKRLFFLVPLLLTGCTGGEPLHRFVFDPEAMSPQTTTLILEKGEKLSFWNSLDVSYKPPVTLQFYISIKAEKEAPVEVLCNALSPSLTFMSSTIEKVNHVAKSWKLARMTCDFGPIDKKKAVTITAAPKAEGIGTLTVDRLVLELKN